jgi:hypothetical protein
MHPIFNEIRKSSSMPYDAGAGKLEYKKKYLDKNLPKADHVDGQEFDNN